MNAQAKRLLAVRSLVAMELCASTQKIVSIDAQLDALHLDEADQQAVTEIKENQDSLMADAVTTTGEICAA